MPSLTTPTPKVTVVMAAYNAEAHVERAIESILAQEFEDWELICVDDGSVDHTYELVSGFATRDQRIRIFQQDNAGPAAARRIGYITGHGDYYVMLDTDDWVAPDFLSALLKVAEDRGADAVICDLQTRAHDRSWESFAQAKGLKEGDAFTGVQAFELTFPWQAHGVCLWRAKLIKTYGVDPDDTSNRYNGDEYLTRKLFLNSNKVIVGPGKYYYESNFDSLTKKNSHKQFYRLETDRRLTNLACASAVPRDVLLKVIRNEGLGLLECFMLLTRFGTFGETAFVFWELSRSGRHYVRSLAESNRLHTLPVFVFTVLFWASKGFLARFGALRSVYRTLLVSKNDRGGIQDHDR